MAIADQAEQTPEKAITPAGPVSSWLTENGFEHEILEADHLGVEMIQVEPDLLIPLATALMPTDLIICNVKEPTMRGQVNLW